MDLKDIPLLICLFFSQEKSVQNDKFSFIIYLCYLVYAPLYIAGPILSFNAFASQVCDDYIAFFSCTFLKFDVICLKGFLLIMLYYYDRKLIFKLGNREEHLTICSSACFWTLELCCSILFLCIDKQLLIIVLNTCIHVTEKWELVLSPVNL